MSDVSTRRILDQLYHNHHPRLLAYARSCFPRLDAGRLEDAVADAFELALNNPELVGGAARQGDAALLGLLRLFIWRGARAQLRRHAYARASSVETGPELFQAPSQEFQAHVRLNFDTELSACANEVCGLHAGAICAALVDALVSGRPETDVAVAHGVQREYLNRARRKLQQRMLAAA